MIFNLNERTVGELKDWTLHRACVPFVKWVHFFLGPWLLVYQFIEISNQMELN